jgi:hypothetical protein
MSRLYTIGDNVYAYDPYNEKNPIVYGEIVGIFTRTGYIGLYTTYELVDEKGQVYLFYYNQLCHIDFLLKELDDSKESYE